MSYIAPNSTIRLYSNVPLDSSYVNTIWFGNLDAQNVYFHGGSGASIVATLQNQYYQREKRNSIKVQLPVGSCYNCNYLAFKNTSFENKWFYAFITNVEYINNEVTEIFYEVDEMQTYQHDVSWNACFVEREHCNPALDIEGNFILPEPVNVGDYVYSGYNKIFDASDILYMVLINDNTISRVNGVAFGLNYYGCSVFTYDSVAGVNALLENYKTHPECLMGIYTIPKSAVVSDGINGPLQPESCRFGPEEYTFNLPNGFVFGNYTPLNRKLFTYPYSCIVVGDSSGVTKYFRREFFNNGYKFNIIKSVLPPVSVSVYPKNYRNASSNGLVGDTITLSGFPVGCWAFNSSNVYAEREKQNIPLQLLSSGLSVGLGVAGAVATGGASLAVAGTSAGLSLAGAGINAVTKSMQIEQNAKYQPDVFGGSTDSNSGAFASGVAGIYAGHARITEENARSIDRFFSLYGYQTNTVKVPNYTGRRHFNYVKTVGSTFSPLANGKVNAFDVDKMDSILNKGITFWHTPAEVGNYTDTILSQNASA